MGYKLKTHSGAAKRFKRTGSSVKSRGANRNHILTMSELDKNIELFYHQTLGRIENGKNLTHGAKKLPRKSGYLGSIREKKQKLEDIFKKS